MPESEGELDLLRAYLRDRDVACPACGHNLHGTAGIACPECGARLDLRVASMDQPHKWWLLALLAFALPLGMFGSLAIAGTWSLAHGWLDRHDQFVFGACLGTALTCFVGVVANARRRTLFLQRTLAQQRVRAIAAVVILLSLSLAVVALMYRGPYEWPWTLIEGTPMP